MWGKGNLKTEVEMCNILFFFKCNGTLFRCVANTLQRNSVPLCRKYTSTEQRSVALLAHTIHSIQQNIIALHV